MNVTLKEISAIKRELEVVVPAEDVEQELEVAYQRIGKKVKIKGFRPGKVPRAVLEQYYRQDAESEVMKDLVQKKYLEAIHEVGIQPVTSPEITVAHFGPSEDFTFQAVVEVPPVIDVKGYAGMKLTKEKIVVTAEEVQENLKTLQERMTQLIPVTERKKAQAHDVVTIDFKGMVDEKPVPGFETKGYVVELATGALFPELESGVFEMEVGEKKRIDVTYPQDWADKNIAGKKAAIEVLLQEIKEKKVPELTDDFAKDLGKFGNLEEVKGKIREEVERDKEQSAKNRLRREVIEKLIKENEFPVPDGMIQMEMEDMYHRIEGNLKAQGITPEQAGLNRDDFFVKNRDEAVFRVKGALLFDAVAQREKIAVTEEEVDGRIEEMARLSGQSADLWKKYYREKNLIFQIEGALREEKTLDFVLSQSKIKVGEKQK